MSVDLLDDVFDIPDVDQSMNPDLAAWAREHETEATENKAARPVAGPCSRCSNRATTRCLRCERPVCTRHHHVMVGICDRCTEEGTEAMKDGGEPRHGESDSNDFADERPRRHAGLDLDWIE